MSAPSFRQLPVNPDEGFPQSFRLAFGGHNYVFQLQVHIAEEVLPARNSPEGLRKLIPLPGEGAYLVLTVLDNDNADGAALLRRKVIPGLVYRAGELAVVVRTIRIALGNLHGIGSYGSELVAGVALR